VLVSRRAGGWSYFCAIVTAIMAIVMLVGGPSMSEGGVWFGYGLIFFFAPMLVVGAISGAILSGMALGRRFTRHRDS
jgi:hypothetical protein